MEHDYEKDIRIDENALDVEWLEQPQLFIHYAKAKADAQRAFDKAKERLEVVRAEVDLDVRNNPHKYGPPTDKNGAPKLTEATITNLVTISSEVQGAQQELNAAKHELGILTAAVQAFDQRKKALENLVVLHGQQYFAGPKVPRDISQEWEARQKQRKSNAAVGARTKRKK